MTCRWMTSSSSANGAAARRATPNAATRRASKSPLGRWGRDWAMRSAWPSRRRNSLRATTVRATAIIDHRTWVIASDGDLMEGVASEAASLAGHLKLGKLICLYDDNKVTLAAGTDITFTEDRAARFAAYGWQVLHVEDGNDLAAIDAALQAACADTTRPSLVAVRTHLGYGSPEQDSFKAHGSPLGEEDVRKTKQALGWPTEPTFLVPDDALAHMREARRPRRTTGERLERRIRAYARSERDLAAELEHSLHGGLPDGWDADIPVFPADAKGMATREASGKIMNAIAPRLPALTGGSADLDPSTKTALKDMGDFNPPLQAGDDTQGSDGGGWSFAGRNIHFGVREHAMGAIANGMAAHNGCIPYTRDLPDLFRLHAPADAPGGAVAPARHPCVHA